MRRPVQGSMRSGHTLTCSAQSSRGSFTTSANGCESGTSRLVNNVTGRRICSQCSRGESFAAFRVSHQSASTT